MGNCQRLDMTYFNLLKFSHSLWQNHLNTKDCAIDATCGNGHDSLFLAQILKNGHLFVFDIQKKALDKTKNLLQQSKLDCKNIFFLHQSHDQFSQNLFGKNKIKLFVYNLGYLPGGNKTITTQTKTTIASLNQALALLSTNGALSITCYPGHAEGAKETKAVKNWLQKIQKNTTEKTQNYFDILEIKSTPSTTSPILFWISKQN